MLSASYYINDCCIGLVRFVFGHIMRWHPVKVQLPSIYKYLDGSCPARALLAAALCYRRSFVFVLLITSCPELMGSGLCYMSSLIASYCTSVKSGVQEGQVGKADIVQGKSSWKSRTQGWSSDIGKGALVLFGL